MEAIYPDLLSGGYRYEVCKTVTASDVYLWAGLTGEAYPVQGASAFAQQATVEGCVVHSAYLSGLIAATVSRLADHIPLPGAILVKLTIQFTTPVLVGTTLSIVVTVTEWDATARLYWLDIRATRADGMLAVLGQAGLRPRTAISIAGLNIAARTV